MAKKQFTLNKEPHEAQIGDDVTLLFAPEVDGDDFLDHYTELQDGLKELHVDLSDLANADVEKVRATKGVLRTFMSKLMLPESRAEFEGLKLPDRVLIELLEWAVELYGGGRPSGSSNGSAPASSSPGTRGRAPSRSRA